MPACILDNCRRSADCQKGKFNMIRRIRYGVIGSGGIAKRRTIPEGLAQANNAELVSVYDINPVANLEVAQQFKAHAVESIEKLLKTDIDAVYIASPVKTHFEHVMICAEAGKHILCEKPLGMTVAEAEEMIAACEKANVLLGTAFMMRFHACHQAALKMIRENKLGRLVYGRAQLSCWYPPIRGAWRQDPATGGGGSLMDMGGHCIDLLEMFFGKVKSVSCYINNLVHKYKSEDSAVVTLMFENGALATVDNYFCIPDSSSKNILELYGSKGSVLAKGTIGQGDSGEMIAYLQKEAGGYQARQSRESTEGMVVSPSPVNTYKAEIEEFSQALIENRKPSVDGTIGLQNQRVIAACYESAKTGATVLVK